MPCEWYEKWELEGSFGVCLIRQVGLKPRYDLWEDVDGLGDNEVEIDPWDWRVVGCICMNQLFLARDS